MYTNVHIFIYIYWFCLLFVNMYIYIYICTYIVYIYVYTNIFIYAYTYIYSMFSHGKPEVLQLRTCHSQKKIWPKLQAVFPTSVLDTQQTLYKHERSS